MKKCLFTGVATALATPFNSNGVNTEEFKKFIQFQISSGVDALVVCGTTGESSTMTKQERIDAITCAIETVNSSESKIPVIVGTGSNNTAYAIEMSILAEKLGADGLLVVTPYYNKTTQSGLIAHFRAIAESVSIPIILYNVPSRTGMNIEPSTCFELSKINNIVGIKEASGNISQVAKIASLCGDDFAIYSGNDDQICPILSLGGKGVISVLSHVLPKETHLMAQYCLENNFAEASKLQIKYLDLINNLFVEVNPIPVKEAMNLIGVNVGGCRMPLYPMSDENREKLKASLAKHGLIK